MKEVPIAKKLATAIERINEKVREYNPIAVLGLFSGGNDSLAAMFATSQADRFTAAVHVNTGIGVEATRDFVRATCADRNWPLLEYKAIENCFENGDLNPMDYEQICLTQGFPGPAMHQTMYVKLKDRQLARLERNIGATVQRPVLYVTGARSDESKRRMGNVQPFQRTGRRLWLNAIHDWSSLDCAGLRLYANLKQNIVCERIGMSGECLCGSFRKDGELEILRGWPETHATYLHIIDLQKRVRAAGFPWGWGERSPRWWDDKKQGQISLLEPDPDTGMELCHNCTKYYGGRA